MNMVTDLGMVTTSSTLFSCGWLFSLSGVEVTAKLAWHGMARHCIAIGSGIDEQGVYMNGWLAV